MSDSGSKRITDLIAQGTQSIVNAIDANGNGTIDIEDFIIHGLRTPGAAIDRASFLKTEFQRYVDQETINKIIQTNPVQANVSSDITEKIAQSIINSERLSATGLSTALGMPGGKAMIATIPADLLQYYAFMLRVAQKLMYLYGFPQIDITENNQTFDSSTVNVLTLCLGVMCGVAGANKALKALAVMLGKGVEQKLLKVALTKTLFYRTVKKIARYLTVNITKESFSGFFRKAIPVIGGLVSGGITYLFFGTCCDRLRAELKDTVFTNPNCNPQEIIDEFIIEAEGSLINEKSDQTD